MQEERRNFKQRVLFCFVFFSQIFVVCSRKESWNLNVILFKHLSTYVYESSAFCLHYKGQEGSGQQCENSTNFSRELIRRVSMSTSWQLSITWFLSTILYNWIESRRHNPLFTYIYGKLIKLNKIKMHWTIGLALATTRWGSLFSVLHSLQSPRAFKWE